MKKTLAPALTLVVLLFSHVLQAQNLVNNPSFETVTAEPYWGCEIINATGWLNPSGGSCPNNGTATPDLFSTFSNGQAVLPNTFMGTTNAHTGNRIAGIVTYHDQLTNYREYLMTRLTCPLVPGETYTVSFWSTGGNPVQYVYHTNNIGVYFSTNALTQNNYNLIPAITPQLEITTLVANTTWTYFSFTFTPTQAYNYITIGNFRNDASTQKQNFGTNRPYSYYFFDDISVTANNSTIGISLGNDTTYCGSFSRTLSTGDPSTVWSTGVTGPQITVTTPGTYWATAAGACGTSSDTITIAQSTTPQPFNFGADTAYCGTFSRVLSSGNPNTVWSTGVTGAQITVNFGGTYWGMVSNACGSRSDTVVITEYNQPVVNLGNDTSVCIGQTTILNAGNPGATYQWQDNSGAQTYSVTTAGNYAVTVTNINGCSASDAVTVANVTSPPAISIGNDTAYCGSFSRTLTSGNPNTLWSTGVVGAQITVNIGGTYWGTVSNACGANSDTIVLTELNQPVVNLGNDTVLCTGNSVVLNAGNPGAVYLWNDNSASATYTVTGAGNYAVTVTNSAGCTATDNINVAYLSQLPVINIGPDTIYCGNFSRTLTSDSVNSVWSTGSNTQQIVVTTPGIYWAETSNACGTTRDSIIVQQNPVPTVWLGNDTPICNGQTIILQPVSSGGSYVWSDGSTGATLDINTAGLYWVEVTLNGCNNRDTIQVNAGTLSAVNLGPDTIVCDNEYTLLLNIPGATYLWENNSTDSFYNISQSGTYTITVTNTCGSSTGEITVELHADECAVLIPTAFSPNEDGANDLFRGICRCPAENYELEIYNRWGELVFKADDIRDGWNGNYQNLQQPLGVYVYQLSYYSYCAQKKVYRKGNVTLVR